MVKKPFSGIPQSRLLKISGHFEVNYRIKVQSLRRLNVISKLRKSSLGRKKRERLTLRDHNLVSLICFKNTGYLIIMIIIYNFKSLDSKNLAIRG